MPDKADILLTLGEPSDPGDWPDYPATHGLAADDVPRLIEILSDEALNKGDGESTEVWGPLHAWRALGQLGAVEAIEPLISQFEFLSEDDWALTEVDRVFAMIGPAAIEPLAVYLGESQHSEYARIMSVDALARIAMAHPEERERVLAIFRDYMKRPDHEAEVLNGALMGRLIDLHAVELIDDIRRLFGMGIVDIFYAGDLEEVEMELGFRETRDTPQPSLADMFRDDSEDTALYHRLEEYLLHYGGDHTISSASELHGFFAAIGCAPEMIPPSLWMPAIWGGEDDMPEWDPKEELEAFLRDIQIFHNTVMDELGRGDFQPLLQERKDEKGEWTFFAEPWSGGFVRGISLWGPMSQTIETQLAEAMAPIALFITEEGRRAQASMDAEQIEQFKYEIGPAVSQLFEQFVKQPLAAGKTYVRKTPKVGRNDPCPCGSGKKYKRCCLH